jgi:hypothetical protein
MFKRIMIELTEPICNCDERDISWGIHYDHCMRAGLSFSCKTCDTKLLVPHDRFVAGFKLDRDYPGKKSEPQKKTTLDVLDGGRAVPFEKDKDDS